MIPLFLVYATVCLTLYAIFIVLLKSHHTNVDVELVFWSAWITMATTGLGVLPFFFIKNVSPRWVAAMNAIAAGMMLSASVGLVEEGVMDPDPSSSFRVVYGLGFGILFIFLTKILLSTQEVNFLELSGMDAKRVCLIMTVMTLHSLSEGVGIGVSYHSRVLGSFISFTMAVHNIPEGVAIAIVLIPRGVSKRMCILYCFLSSFPQPLMAVPSFLFVDAFAPLFSVGLGFASGAMGFVAVFELLQEALETLPWLLALAITALSSMVMVFLQLVVK